MFSRVALATDFSDASNYTLECVAAWKELGLQKVTLVNVHDIHIAGGLQEMIRHDVEPRLARQQGRLCSAGLQATTRLEFGIPYLDIDRIAVEEGAEAIVLGSHGASWMTEVLVGTVADGVIRHSALPVLLVKVDRLRELAIERCRPHCASMFDRLLVATDFSARAGAALAAAEQAARRFHCEVVLVHVQEVGRLLPHLKHRLEEFDRIDSERLTALASKLREAGARDVRIDIRLDHPVRGIVAAAQENHATLLVVGAHGRGHVAEALLGSTAHGLAHRSPIPVLLMWQREGGGSHE